MLHRRCHFINSSWSHALSEFGWTSQLEIRADRRGNPSARIIRARWLCNGGVTSDLIHRENGRRFLTPLVCAGCLLTGLEAACSGKSGGVRLRAAQAKAFARYPQVMHVMHEIHKIHVRWTLTLPKQTARVTPSYTVHERKSHERIKCVFSAHPRLRKKARWTWVVYNCLLYTSPSPRD